jgi:aspartokinase-like uncharacterized kinase
VETVVVKVGGSLFDLPDLGPRLEAWIGARSGARIILVPGGGAAAGVVRDLDRRHSLGAEASHWLALRALRLNAEFLAAILRRVPAQVIEDLNECAGLWSRSVLPVLDAYAFARADEGRPGSLPHSWLVTSDSVSARVSVVTGASQLILLKSVTIPQEMSWQQASMLGLVDEHFPTIAEQIPSARAINFRDT